MQKRLFGLLASAAIVFGACQGAATTAPSASESAPPSAAPSSAAPTESAAANVDLFASTYPTRVDKNGVKGGQVIIGDWQEANQWMPMYQGQVIEGSVTSATWRGLVASTDDFKYANDLAADPAPLLENGGVKVPGDNGDAMTVTWHLKPNQVWSDGQPITCDDLVATWKWVIDPNNAGIYGGTSGWTDITSIDCPDPLTSVQHWKAIYFDYLTLYSAPNYPVLPKHYIETIPVADQVKGKGWSNADMPNVPVSGPYKFESITPGQELRLIRNDKYVNPLTGQPAWLDTVIYKWYADADAMIAGYKAGEVDTAGDLTDGDIPKVQDLGDQVHANLALQYEFLRPNWGSPIMKDLAMRQALAYSVDKNEVNTRILGGNAQVAWTNTSPYAWYYVEPTNKMEFNLDKAKSILDAAGWTPGADGIRVKDGVVANVKLCTTTRQARQDNLALVSGWLKEIGVASTVNAVSPADIFATYNESTAETPCNLSRHNFDVALHTFSVPLSPNSNYAVYRSGQEAPNGQNDAQINDPKIDDILDQLKGTVDFAKAKDLMAQFTNEYVDQVVEVPEYFRKDVNLVQPYVKNWTGNPSTPTYSWNIQDWFIQK